MVVASYTSIVRLKMSRTKYLLYQRKGQRSWSMENELRRRLVYEVDIASFSETFTSSDSTILWRPERSEHSKVCCGIPSPRVRCRSTLISSRHHPVLDLDTNDHSAKLLQRQIGRAAGLSLQCLLGEDGILIGRSLDVKLPVRYLGRTRKLQV